MLQCHIKISFEGITGEDKGICHLLEAGVDEHKEITAAVLVPMFSPPRIIVDIDTYVAGDSIIRHFPLLIAYDHVGQ